MCTTTESPALLAIVTGQFNTQTELLDCIREVFREIDELSILDLQRVVPCIKDVKVAQEFMKLLIDWCHAGKEINKEEEEHFDLFVCDMVSDMMCVPGFQKWANGQVVEWPPLVDGDAKYRKIVSEFIVGTWGIGELMDRMTAPWQGPIGDDVLSMAQKTLGAWAAFVDFVVDGRDPEQIDLEPFVSNSFDLCDLLDDQVADAFPIDDKLIRCVCAALQDPEKASVLNNVFSPFMRARDGSTPWVLDA